MPARLTLSNKCQLTICMNIYEPHDNPVTSHEVLTLSLARPYKLATKSKSTAYRGQHVAKVEHVQLGRHCQKQMIFVVRVLNILSTFCQMRHSRLY